MYAFVSLFIDLLIDLFIYLLIPICTGVPALLEPRCEWGRRHVFLPHSRHENAAMASSPPTREPAAAMESAALLQRCAAHAEAAHDSRQRRERHESETIVMCVKSISSFPLSLSLWVSKDASTVQRFRIEQKKSL